MRKKLPILSGMIFLIILMSLMSISAQYDWTTYGNGFSPLWQEQYSGGYGRFDIGITNISIPYGYTPYTIGSGYIPQPLVAHFDISPIQYKEYLIFPNGNYLQVYDDSLNLRQEINTGGESIAQIDTMAWGNVSSGNIAGIWRINTTDIAFRVYTYNIGSNSLINSYEKNFTSNITKIAGIRHTSGTAIFILPIQVNNTNYINQFIKINSLGIINQINFTNRPCAYTEPLAFTDMDNDGLTEYLTYCTGSYGNLLIFDENGNIKYNYTSTGGYQAGFKKLLDVKILKIDATNNWRIAILEGETYFSYPNYHSTGWLTLKRIDGTNIWTKSLSGGGSYGRLSIVDDYNGDGFNDIYSSIFRLEFTTIYLNPLILEVTNGNNGANLKQKNWADIGDANSNTYSGEMPSLTIADLNNDNYWEFIFAFQRGYYIYDIKNDNLLLSSPPLPNIPATSCIPADLNVDGFQEIICSGKDNTIVFYSTAVNGNAVINSVIYDPATTIAKQTTLNAIVSATDPEGNSPLYYISKCSDSLNWSVEDNNNVRVCYYSSVGTYNLTIAVRDPYHSTYVYFSQPILVTETGIICGNGICESGETYTSCPADCPSNVTQTQATATGGMPLPTKIVDVNNIEQGLLPEIYYGILGFLSNTLSPMIILVFAIFFVMIILTLAFIIKRVAHRIGNLSK